MAKQKRMNPDVFDFHGLPIHYRIELRSEAQKPKALSPLASTGGCPAGSRKKIPTILLSIRNDEGIIYEAAKRFPKESNGDINRALELLAPQILKTYFALGSKDRLDRRKTNAESGTLTFYVLWIIDMDIFQKAEDWKKGTVDKYNRLMTPLLAEFHDLPFDQLTPVVCTPILEKLSYEDHRQCANLIRRIFNLECALGVYKKNPWSNYYPQSRRKKGKTTENLQQKALTTGQCREIMELCCQRASNPGNGSIYLAAAALLLTGLSLPELCALRLSNIKILSEPKNCLAIQVEQKRYLPDHAKQYTIKNLDEGYQKRILVLPDLLSFLLRTHFPNLEDLTEKQLRQPLIHDPKNRLHFIRPDQLRSDLQTIFGDICSSPEFSKKKISVANRLRQTAQNNLQQVGLTEEEMRYHFGWVPQTTAAKSYNDFACGSQLNRRRRILNRWAAKIDPRPADRSTQKTAAGTRIFSPVPGKLCDLHGDLLLNISGEETSDGLSFTLSAVGGLRHIHIKYL